MMNIDINHLARLAKLALSEDEKTNLEQDLNNLSPIIEHIRSVSTDVEPLAHPLEQAQFLREDEVTAINERDSIQKITAPTIKDGYYLVPQVIES